MEKIFVMCNTDKCKKAILEQLKDFDIAFIDSSPINELSIDRFNQKVYYKGNQVFLTPVEFKMISLLSSDRKKIFSRKDIMNYAFNGFKVNERTVDV